MRDFIATAEALRIVKKAQEKFLALWAVECLISQKGEFDAIAMDVALDDPRRQKLRGKSKGDRRAER